MRIKMKRLLSILLSLALVLMPGMSMTAHAATYSSNVDSLQVGDILEPGARYEAREKTITLSANGWCTGVTNDEQTTYTQETVPKEFEPGSMNTLTICDSSYGGDKIGAIKVNGNFYFPYANGAKAEAWVVVAVEGN